MAVWIAAVLVATSQFAQSSTGELHLTIRDAAQLPLSAAVELVSEANQVRTTLESDSTGVLVAKRLPFGVYRLTVSRDGFVPFVGNVEIRSALPTDRAVWRAPRGPCGFRVRTRSTIAER